MAQLTGIEWTDMSANPIRAVRKRDGKRGHACVHASTGCINCYSERWNGWRGTGLKFNVPFLSQVDIILDQKELARMRKVKASNKVFVCDMTDLFGPFVPDEYIIAVFAAMCANQGATWQVLTKRPERMAVLLSNGDFWVEVALAMHGEAQTIDFPPPHIWCGASIENDAYTWRADELRKVPAVVRFISAEPLLGPLPSLDLDGIHWLIAGAESGHGARTMDVDWVRDLRDRCAAAGTKFFYKQDAQRGHKLPLPLVDGRQWMEMPG